MFSQLASSEAVLKHLYSAQEHVFALVIACPLSRKFKLFFFSKNSKKIRFSDILKIEVVCLKMPPATQPSNVLEVAPNWLY